MKERPIIFNADMVRAILDGRKTQTRRPLRIQPEIDGNMLMWKTGKDETTVTGLDLIPSSFKCPFGQPGDRLWVRETFFHFSDFVLGQNEIYYRADGERLNATLNGGWKPSIHMPRWASRILLEITDIRVERVQDISDEDAIREGVSGECVSEEDDFGNQCGGLAWRNYLESDVDYDCLTAKESYTSLWDSIYGNWNENPWVWVIEFKRIEPA